MGRQNWKTFSRGTSGACYLRKREGRKWGVGGGDGGGGVEGDSAVVFGCTGWGLTCLSVCLYCLYVCWFTSQSCG